MTERTASELLKQVDLSDAKPKRVFNKKMAGIFVILGVAGISIFTLVKLRRKRASGGGKRGRRASDEEDEDDDDEKADYAEYRAARAKYQQQQRQIPNPIPTDEQKAECPGGVCPMPQRGRTPAPQPVQPQSILRHGGDAGPVAQPWRSQPAEAPASRRGMDTNAPGGSIMSDAQLQAETDAYRRAAFQAEQAARAAQSTTQPVSQQQPPQLTQQPPVPQQSPQLTQQPPQQQQVLQLPPQPVQYPATPPLGAKTEKDPMFTPFS